MKGRIWSTDWFAGLIFSLVFAVAAFFPARQFFYGFETAAYDRFMQLSFAQPNRDIAVIAIDDHSIDNIGRWPWSRDLLAQAIDQLASGGAKVIASTIFVAEPQIDPGLDTLRVLANELSGPGSSAESRRVGRVIESRLLDLNYDQRLGDSVRNAGNVILPMGFSIGEPLGAQDGPLPDYVVRNTLNSVVVPDSGGDPAIPSRRITPPTPLIGKEAAGLGHLTLLLDDDGANRFEPLVLRYFGHYFPSLALAVTARQINLTLQDIELRLGEGIRLGGLDIYTTPDMRMFNYFYSDRAGKPPFSVDSFYDVFTGRVPVDKFRDKVVLIGATASGVGDNIETPVSAAMPPVLALAHTISSLLEEHFYVRPPWARAVEIGLLAVVALYLMVVLPRLRAGLGALVTIGIVVALLGTEFTTMNSRSAWLQLMLPVMLLISGHIFMTIKRFRVSERLKLHSDAEGAESNKMLGLAFQSQGQLEMAFEKFRRCPVDDNLLDVLYNLALDYERKRQFNKAGAVYSYMAQHDAHFRDIGTRIKRAREMENTVVLGGGGVASTSGTVVLAGEGMEKPMLGRYVIEREIGKGAMGTVYQGRDPKINRIVAIKTIPLSTEFEPDELASAKDRFFREAESAGRLSHPDIVTVFDAGEEQDLAYIAMEFLRGGHLNDRTRADNLFPPEKALDLIARVSQALDFAHRQGIVHRDIKPANIMYDEENDELKITDFGIARITDASKTKTGIVLGTPSYMAPEQLAGKNVNGHSDLFSLGVTLFQLLTGQLPFRADSMATLMFKIANEPHTPLSAVRPDLPDCIGQIIDRTLAKDPDDRYESGAALAFALKECIRTLAPAEAAS